MTRIEEKLYLQSVFDAIDEVYQLKNPPKTLTYEERLRASISKLFVPDWFNNDYTSDHKLRKTKSHGQVTRQKCSDNNNNNDHHGISNTSLSSFNDASHSTHRHRSPSRSRSERPTYRCNSSTSSYDTNGSVILNGRRLPNSTGSSTYTPGAQRVALASRWYKPKAFTVKSIDGYSAVHPPKPLPRCLKMDQKRIDSTDSSSSSLPIPNSPIANGNLRHPIKPRTMSQIPIPTEPIEEESSSSPLNLSLDASSDGDITVVQKGSSSSADNLALKSTDVPSIPLINISITHPNDDYIPSMTILRTESAKSFSSDAESYRSAILPPSEKNLLLTDSSSYASVNDPCSSISTSSYHTAVVGDASSSSSSVTGYETPTPQFDDETVSSRSSISDLSHTETLALNVEDLDVVTVSREEQKPAVIPPVHVGMEKLPLPSFPSTTSNTSPTSSTNENSPTTDSRVLESTNWYDDGSIETCIHQTSSSPNPLVELREIPNDEILHEVDTNGVGDEFFLFSSRNTTLDEEPPSSSSADKHENHFEQFSSPTDTSRRLYSMENDIGDFNDPFLYSSSVDPFGSSTNNSSIMITNLDDILIDDDDEEDEQNNSKDPLTYLLNTSSRRPIQEDILYEVEHENSYSDHSQNTSSILVPDDNMSIKAERNSDALTIEEAANTDDQPSSYPQTSSVQEDRIQSNEMMTAPAKQTRTDSSTLPIFIPPPLFTTTDQSSSLHIDTTSNPSMYKWNSPSDQYPDLFSPSSYTSKIRHRHFPVGSYYDNQTTTVAIHPNNTLYILGSAPVSPINRASIASSESHYHMHHHSPVSYGNVTLNALRRVNPFLETPVYTPNYLYQRSSSLNRTDYNRTLITPPAMPITPTSLASAFPPRPISPTRSPQLERPPPLEREPPLVRPKTSRGRARTPPKAPPPRTISLEQETAQNIYQEIDTVSTDDDPITSPNTDLQFIRGTIKRVFDFHGESASESSANYEEISEDHRIDNESISSSGSSKTLSKKNDQHAAVEAVQRFYDTKTPSNSENKKSADHVTNLDDLPSSDPSSASNKLYARSHPAHGKKNELFKSKSSHNEQISSEEVDDTLNDIEDDDYHHPEDKLKRQTTGNSSSTSNEESPLHSSDNQKKGKKTSQETQTTHRGKPVTITTQSPLGSQSTVQSYETARSSVPPLDIVTQMVIERDDGIDDGQIDEISGDMIIFYDDIEIVEHSSNISSTDSESNSSMSNSLLITKPVEVLPPPPIPARTLKPVHLLYDQQQSPVTPRNEPIIGSSSKTNRIYELEKATTRRKVDVNSVNDMLNRTDYYIGPTASHRHPSARHFVGKLNSDDGSSRKSSLTGPNTMPSAAMKSQTLPSKSAPTNGHSTTHVSRAPTKSPSSTLPTRSLSSSGTNEKRRSVIGDTNALVKQIQNSLSRNSLHDSRIPSPLSISTKDLRTFVSSTYSPSDENMIDNDGVIHTRVEYDDQAFKRQARLSKSFHNVSEYSSIDQYPKKENQFTPATQPSKSVENHLNRVSQIPKRHSQIPLNFPPVVSSASFSAIPHSEDNARMLSMKWYTGQVSENSEICFNTPHIDRDDLLYGYITAHSTRETQSIFARLQASNDIRIHAALDDIRLRVAQFDASKSPEDMHVFMRYLESRLRDISNKNASLSSSTTTSHRTNGQGRMSNGGTTNGYHTKQQQSDTVSIKSRASSITTGLTKETPPSRQLGRQHLRSSGNLAGGGGGTNVRQSPAPPPHPARRASQSSINQENPVMFDDMLNTVLGLPKKGASTLPQTYPSTSSSQSRDKSTPLAQTQTSPNTTPAQKSTRDASKRLFESGTYRDPRLIYDGPKKPEKEEQPVETSV